MVWYNLIFDVYAFDRNKEHDVSKLAEPEIISIDHFHTSRIFRISSGIKFLKTTTLSSDQLKFKVVLAINLVTRIHDIYVYYANGKINSMSQDS